MKRHDVRISIFREGEINATQNQSTPFQCVVQGFEHYYYNATVMVTNPTLDERGFIIDHNDMHDFIIQQCAAQIKSCEIVASEVATCISDWLLSQGINHDYVHFVIASKPIVENKGMNAWAYPNYCVVNWKNQQKRFEEEDDLRFLITDGVIDPESRNLMALTF